VATTLSVLIVDENPDRATLIRQGLDEAGYGPVQIASSVQGLVRVIEEFEPAVIVIDLANPGRDLLEHMFLVSRAVQRPIAMFVDQSDEDAMFRAIEAGVSAYVVDGLRKERIKPVLDLAVMRFRAFEKLRGERDSARAALDDRRLLDIAKGLIMKREAIDEETAHKWLRETAMRRRISVSEVAREVAVKGRES
jgi:response regulator NasT